MFVILLVARTQYYVSPIGLSTKKQKCWIRC